MNRNLLLAITWMLSSLSAYSQQTSMTVDNQTPGWLSSKIVYTDQQTLKDLKVTGYINGTDINFIKDLNTKRALIRLDLSEAHIVAGGDPYYDQGSSYYTEDDKITTFLFGAFNHMEKIILPLTTNDIKFSSFSSEGVDTLIVNGTFTDLKLQSFLYVKNICISEGFTSITADVSIERGFEIESIMLPNTLSSIRGNADRNTTTTIISFIQNPQNVQNVEYSQGRSFKDNWRGKIYVPEGTTEKYENSCFSGMTIVEMIEAKNIIISNNTLALHTNENQQLTATITPDETFDKSVLWKSSDENVATVDAYGNVTAVSTGEAQIAAETSNGLTAICDITVYDHTTGVTMDKTAEINIGEPLQLTAQTLPLGTSDGLVTWSSDNKYIATVSDEGVVTGVSQGSCIITATSIDGNFTASCHVKVLQPITAIQLDRNEATVNTGNSIQLEAIISPTNADNKEVSWTSSNEEIATVGNDGTVTGKKAGTAIITVMSAENEDIKDECEITVLQLRQRLILSRHLREAGRIAQTERRIFIENLFVHTPVVFQHKGVVFRRDKQHIINALIHQIGKRGVFKHQILKIRYSAHVCIRSYLTAPNVEKKTIQQTVFRRVNRNTPKVVRFSLRPTEGTPACAIFCMYIHILITRKRRDKEFKKYICAFEYYS